MVKRAKDSKDRKVKQVEEQMKRAVADYRNLQARMAREKEEFAKYANERLLTAFLPVRDGLVQALKQLGDKSGVELILKQFDDTLSQEGVSKIEFKVGSEFDPEIMEAIDSIKAESAKQEGTIAKAYRAGFKYKGRVLRPAEVRVYT